MVAGWLAGHRHTPSPTRKAAAQELAICELVLAYLRFAQTYYAKNGRVRPGAGHLLLLQGITRVGW